MAWFQNKTLMINIHAYKSSTPLSVKLNSLTWMKININVDLCLFTHFISTLSQFIQAIGCLARLNLISCIDYTFFYYLVKCMSFCPLEMSLPFITIDLESQTANYDDEKKFTILVFYSLEAILTVHRFWLYSRRRVIQRWLPMSCKGHLRSP